jgi:ABC-type branched-subunit amino acid transport system ATPase component
VCGSSPSSSQVADFFSEFTVLESLLIGRWKFSSHSVIASMLRLRAVRRSDRDDGDAAVDMLAGLGLDQHRTDRFPRSLTHPQGSSTSCAPC